MTIAPPTSIDPRSDSYAANRAAMQSLLDEVRAAEEQVLDGSGARCRQRLDLLLDRDSPFLELGALAGWGTDDRLGGGQVLGIGIIEGVECLVVADEPSQAGGHPSPTAAVKARRGHELALRNRLPLVHLAEPAEGAPSGTHELALLTAAGIPTITVAFGPLGPTSSENTICVSPPTIGLDVEVAHDEIDALRLARQTVRHLNWRKRGPGATQPATPPLLDPDELLALPSADVRLPFEVREVIWRMVDRSQFDELKPHFGTQLVAGWASLCGHPVGIVANNGALFGDEIRKGRELVARCNDRGLPIIFLQHFTDLTSHSGELVNVVAGATVPHLTVMIGASYGSATMAGRAQEPRFVFTWPNHRSIEREAGALDATGRQWDDGIIDPRDTRVVLGIASSCVHSAEVISA